MAKGKEKRIKSLKSAQSRKTPRGDAVHFSFHRSTERAKKLVGDLLAWSSKTKKRKHAACCTLEHKRHEHAHTYLNTC